jgi:ubiquinone/menaquinone biosynthesis C-methylase UbiE
MTKHNDKVIKTHYTRLVNKFRRAMRSTIEDDIICEREIEFISNFVKFLNQEENKELKILDLGCGSGYTLKILAEKYPKNHYWGVDITKEMIKIAKNAKLSNCNFFVGDARSLKFKENYFDFIFVERCLINILNWGEQKKALNEIWRALKPEGCFLMIECFTDGLKNNNRARKECGLKDLEPAYHNKYIEKKLFLKAIKNRFKVIKPESILFDEYFFHQNFLSSHYFIARVLHALITKGKQVKNTEFVKFFSFLPPIGNYSPIQAYILKKITNK